MRVITLTSIHEIAPADWDALLVGEQPFQQHAFLCALEDSGSLQPASGWAAAHRILLADSGEMLAAAPGYLKRHSFGEYVFDQSWAQACERAGIAYYPKLLTAIPFSPVSGQRLLGPEVAVELLLTEIERQLPEQGLSSWHINFTNADDAVLLQGREGWLARTDCQFHWRNQGYRDFQDFLDSLSSRKRKQMRKERMQVAAQGLSCSWHQGDELSEAQWDFVYQCYANTYLIRGRQPYLTRQFFSLLAQNMPQLIRVLIAKQACRPAAMAFYLQAGDSLYGRYWGCLEEFAGLHFEACMYQGMEYAIAQQLQRFDAGAQGEHKLVRGFEPVLTQSWHYLCHSGLRAAVAEFLEQECPAVLAYARQAREHLPFKQLG